MRPYAKGFVLVTGVSLTLSLAVLLASNPSAETELRIMPQPGQIGLQHERNSAYDMIFAGDDFTIAQAAAFMREQDANLAYIALPMETGGYAVLEASGSTVRPFFSLAALVIDAEDMSTLAVQRTAFNLVLGYRKLVASTSDSDDYFMTREGTAEIRFQFSTSDPYYNENQPRESSNSMHVMSFKYDVTGPTPAFSVSGDVRPFGRILESEINAAQEAMNRTEDLREARPGK